MIDCMYVCVFQPFEVVQICVPLTVKGDEKNIYRVTLMALVSTTAGWPLHFLRACVCEVCLRIHGQSALMTYLEPTVINEFFSKGTNVLDFFCLFILRALKVYFCSSPNIWFQMSNSFCKGYTSVTSLTARPLSSWCILEVETSSKMFILRSILRSPARGWRGRGGKIRQMRWA